MSNSIFHEGEVVDIILRERTLCMKAICCWCREDKPVQWYARWGGLWTHYDIMDGEDLGICRANAIRKLEPL